MKKYFWFRFIFKIRAIASIIMSWLCLAQIGYGQERGPVVVFEDTITKGNTYAILVGISEYKHMKPLQYADKDALLFKQFLLSKAGGEVLESNIKTILNKDATAANISAGALYHWLTVEKKLQRGDKVYLFFAGHGDAISKDEYYFLAYNCEPANDKSNYDVGAGVGMFYLKSKMKQLTSAGVEVILIMDACRTGGLPGGRVGQTIFSQSIAEENVGEILLLSAGPEQVSYEDKAFGGGHGLFSYFLIEGLSGSADKDQNSYVTLRELELYVGEKVEIMSRNRYNNYQVPVFCCSDRRSNVMSNSDEKFRDEVMALGTIGDLYKQGTAHDNGGRNDIVYVDTTGLFYYNQMLNAIQGESFKDENNARKYLDKIIEQCDDCEITGEAKKRLAVAYLDYGQSRINLYLTGKSTLASIRSIKTKNKHDKNGYENSELFDDRLKKLEVLVNLSFEDAEKMMTEALELLNDSLISTLYEKQISFLNLYGKKKDASPETSEYWTQLVRERLANDSAAYMFDLAGQIYTQLELYDDARNYYTKAIKLAPKWSLPVDGYAVSLSIEGKYNKAEEWYLKAIEVDSNYINPYRNRARNFHYQNKYKEAEAAFLKAISVDSTDVISYAGLGDVYTDQKKYVDAEKYYKKALSIDKTGALGCVSCFGWLLIKQKRYDEAEHLFRLIIQSDSSSAYAYKGIGEIFYEQKKYKEAEFWYLKAVKTDSSYIYAYYDLGILFGEQRKFDLAEKWLLKAAEIDKNSADAFVDLGDFYLKQEIYDKAEEYYLKAMDIDNICVNAYLGMGLNYHEQTMYDEAEEWYIMATQIDSSYTNTYYWLGKLYYNQGLNWRAIQTMKDAIRFDSTDVSLYYEIANFYLYSDYDEDESTYDFSENYIEEATEWLLKLLDMDSAYNKAYFLLGDIFYHQDEMEKAEQLYLRGMKEDPNDWEAYLQLAYLGLRKYQNNKWFNKGAAIDIYDPFYLSEVGNFFSQIKKYRRASRWHLRAIEIDPYRTEFYNSIGLNFYTQRKYSQAEKWFMKAARASSKPYDYNLDRGDFYFDRKKYRDAKKWYEYAFMASPDPVTTAIDLADRYFYEFEMLEDAEKWYLKALNVDSSAKAYYNLGHYYWNVDRDNEAEECYLSAIAADQYFVDAYLSLGSFYSIKGINSTAEEFYKRAVEIDSVSAETHSRVGGFYHAAGDLVTSEYYFRRALELGAPPDILIPLLSDANQRGDYPLLLKYTLIGLQNALTKKEKTEWNNYVGWQYYLLGMIDSAKYFYNQAGFTQDALTNIAGVYLSNNQPDSALVFLKKMSRLTTEPDVHQLLLEYLANSLIGNDTNALVFLERAHLKANSNLRNVSQKKEDLFEAILCSVMLQTESKEEDLQSLFITVKNSHFSYDFIMSYKPLLIQPFIFDHPGFEEMIKKIYPYWY